MRRTGAYKKQRARTNVHEKHLPDLQSAIKRKKYIKERMSTLIKLNTLSVRENVALAQMIEVSIGKRPQIDASLQVSDATNVSYQMYEKLSPENKRFVIRNINSCVVNSILRNVDERAGEATYRKLMYRGG